MTILDEIIQYKRHELVDAKKQVTIKELEQYPTYNRQPISLKKALIDSDSSGIIAEYKRQSPSKGVINDYSSIEEVTKGYVNSGVAAQSILTDTHFFGGKLDDLLAARAYNTTKPILRKDFILDPFQVHEAKAIGADAILLIAACLTAKELTELGRIAQDIGLEILYEVHTQEDLDKINDIDNKIIGINNRDLKTFKVDIEHSIQLAAQLPASTISVSESGISDPKVVVELKRSGFQGFLIGENFMKTSDPGQSCQTFIDRIDEYGN